MRRFITDGLLDLVCKIREFGLLATLFALAVYDPRVMLGREIVVVDHGVRVVRRVDRKAFVYRFRGTDGMPDIFMVP